MITCPRCNGGKEYPAFVDYAPDSKEKSGLKIIACPTCHGAGLVSKTMAEAIDHGRELRELRMLADLSLREAAKIVSLQAVEYSELERGNVDRWKQYGGTVKKLLQKYGELKKEGTNP